MACGMKIELGIGRKGGCCEKVADMARNDLPFGDFDSRKSETGRMKRGHALWEQLGKGGNLNGIIKCLSAFFLY